MNTVIGSKIGQSQKFLENGMRIPVTQIWVGTNPVVQIKSQDKNKYSAVQLGFGAKKHPTKAQLGHIRGAKLETVPQFLCEVRILDKDVESMPKIGDLIRASDVLKPGDIVDVVGVSKGKGYAGVVKKHNFKGGPRTHGQSDRERAPGSIGQATTPGRVYKGKRMAGRMGHARVTVRNLQVVDIKDNTVFVKGLVPGPMNNLIMVTKVSENAKFVALYKKGDEGKSEILSQVQDDEEIKEKEGENAGK